MVAARIVWVVLRLGVALLWLAPSQGVGKPESAILNPDLAIEIPSLLIEHESGRDHFWVKLRLVADQGKDLVWEVANYGPAEGAKHSKGAAAGVTEPEASCEHQPYPLLNAELRLCLPLVREKGRPFGYWGEFTLETTDARRVLLRLQAFGLVPLRPNILLIVADDIGYGDLGAYRRDVLGNGDEVLTPNLDRLASQGMRFTDAHSPAAVCAPTRYSLASGNNPYRGRLRWGVWRFNEPSQFRAGQQTVGEILQGLGYNTAFIGKSHWGTDWYEKGSDAFYRGDDLSQIDFSRKGHDVPVDRGFDYSFVCPNGIQGQPFGFFENGFYRRINGSARTQMVLLPAGAKNDGIVFRDGWGDPDWDSSKVGPTLSKKAIEFIQSHHASNLAGGTDNPFMMMYMSQAIHDPHTPPDYFSPGEPTKGVTDNGNKGDMIYELDQQVGRIVETLEQLGLAEDTLILFTSDNGGLPNRTREEWNTPDSMLGLRGHKGTPYEGGHRVPFIARWGDGSTDGSVIQPNSISQQTISITDWAATVLSLAGYGGAPNQVLDSTNILSVLEGVRDSNLPVHEFLILESRQHLKTDVNVLPEDFLSHIVRLGNHVLLLDFVAASPAELYDLAADPEQEKNLINDPKQAVRIRQMKSLHQRFSRQDGPRMAPLLGTEDHQTMDLSGDRFESDMLIRIIGEQTRLLTTDLPVDVAGVAGRTFGPFASPKPNAHIVAGTIVTSYLLHLDPEGAVGTTAALSMTFDRNIVGLIFSDSALDASDPLFGRTGAIYPSSLGASATTHRGAITEGVDNIAIRDDGRTIDLLLTVGSDKGAIDQLRVILAND